MKRIYYHIWETIVEMIEVEAEVGEGLEEEIPADEVLAEET